MTLFEALRVLAETHTRDDDVTGFVVMVGVSPASPMSPHPVEAYNEAWNVVREQLHMATFPQPEPVKPSSDDDTRRWRPRQIRFKP